LAPFEADDPSGFVFSRNESLCEAHARTDPVGEADGARRSRRFSARIESCVLAEFDAIDDSCGEAA